MMKDSGGTQVLGMMRKDGMQERAIDICQAKKAWKQASVAPVQDSNYCIPDLLLLFRQEDLSSRHPVILYGLDLGL